MKTYIFAIGGTGARVMRSLTFLMGLNIDLKQEVIPMIIDMDIQNGDGRRTLQILESYRSITQNAYLEPVASGFFRNPVGILGKIQQQGSQPNRRSAIKDSFQLDFGDVNVSFFDFIKGSNLAKIDRDLLGSLFSDTPSDFADAELHLKLNHGFKGNPNIGSLVFNNLVDTKEFKHFQNIFQEGDRIFIVSSIFGGTGASGFPQLVKNIRASNNNVVRNAPVGGLVVMPYFRVTGESKSSIDSRAFNSKTKAALTYYSTELDGQLEEVYYLADRPGQAIENNMGGTNQQNNAHVVELLGAKAILNFVNKIDFNRSRTSYYEFGIKDFAGGQDKMTLGFEDFHSDQVSDKFWKAFVCFSLFAKFYRTGLDERRDQPFYKALEIDQLLQSNLVFIELSKYLDHYWVWLQEMYNNDRSFRPFNLNSSFNNFLRHKALRGLDPTFLTDYFSKKLNAKFNQYNNLGKISREEKFLRMAFECMEETFDEKIKELPRR